MQERLTILTNWVGFWPGEGPEPFHLFINDTGKHVFTSRPREQDWSNTVWTSTAWSSPAS